MTLVLDAGALVAIERNERPMWIRLEAAQLDNEIPLTHAGVLGQTWRGGSRQARLARALPGRAPQCGRRVGSLRTYGGGVQIGMLSGSQGPSSANTAILTVAQRHIDAAGHMATWVSGIDAVPFFRADLVDDPPDPVVDFRCRLDAVDAVLIAAPEYAAGLAGGTKNALDWLVGDSTLHRKIVGVASAGTTGGPFAIEQLVRTISWQGGYVVSVLGVAAPRTKSNHDGAYTDATTLRDIAEWVGSVLTAAEGTGAARRALLSSVVERFGIDINRFGTID